MRILENYKYFLNIIRLFRYLNCIICGQRLPNWSRDGIRC